MKVTRSYALLFIVLNTLVAAWLSSPCSPYIWSLKGTKVAALAITFALALAALLILIMKMAIEDMKRTQTIPTPLFLSGCASLVFFKLIASMAAKACGH
ncbi:hypothetical protein [Aquitalea pelogenes]|uniref:hypothetical protein n=1 Tax=Aquitalea pelogenes TaxID=1293573 RepID=UPI0035B1822E